MLIKYSCFNKMFIKSINYPPFFKKNWIALKEIFFKDYLLVKIKVAPLHLKGADHPNQLSFLADNLWLFSNQISYLLIVNY